MKSRIARIIRDVVTAIVLVILILNYCQSQANLEKAEQILEQQKVQSTLVIEMAATVEALTK